VLKKKEEEKPMFEVSSNKEEDRTNQYISIRFGFRAIGGDINKL